MKMILYVYCIVMYTVLSMCNFFKPTKKMQIMLHINIYLVKHKKKSQEECTPGKFTDYC